MKSSISQIKNSVEILSSRLNQIKNRIRGLEDKVGLLQHLDEEEKYKLQMENISCLVNV
jgi:hypothetical protein